MYTNSTFYPWSYVEAVDGQGRVLGTSRNQITFTPSPGLQGYCAHDFCSKAEAYGLPGEVDPKPFIPHVGINSVPWIDPDHPESHYNLGQPGAAAPPSAVPQGAKGAHGNFLLATLSFGLAADYTLVQAEWIVPVTVMALAVIGVILILGFSRRQWHPQRGKEHRSSEPLSEHETKASTCASKLRWWDWRRWVDSQKELHNYIPLSEQRPHRDADP
jgi:hypothetical protein